MRVKVISEIQSAKGIIPAGQIIEIPPAIMEKLEGKVELLASAITSTEKTQPVANTMVICRNHYSQSAPGAREESLQQIMTATWESTFDRVAAIWPRGFVSTPEICAAELEIEKVQALVLSGKSKIADFRQAVEAWERKINQEVIS